MKKIKILMGLIMMCLCVVSISKMTYADAYSTEYTFELNGFDDSDNDNVIMFEIGYKNVSTGEIINMIGNTRSYFYKEPNRKLYDGKMEEGVWELEKIKIYYFNTYEEITGYCICDVPESIEIKNDNNIFKCEITLTDELQTQDKNEEESPHGEEFSKDENASSTVEDSKDDTETTSEKAEVKEDEKTNVDVTITKDDDNNVTVEKSNSTTENSNSNILLYIGLAIGIILILIGVVMVVLKLKKKE